MTKGTAHDVYIDYLSVAICPGCPFDECHDTRPECPWNLAREEQCRGPRVVTLPGPRPDGVMRDWECEVGQ